MTTCLVLGTFHNALTHASSSRLFVCCCQAALCSAGLRACRLPTFRPCVVQAAQHHFGEAKESSLAKAGSWANPGYVETACGALKLARDPRSIVVGIPRSFGAAHAYILIIQHERTHCSCETC